MTLPKWNHIFLKIFFFSINFFSGKTKFKFFIPIKFLLEKKTKINNFIFASSIDLIRRIFKLNNNQISNLRKTGFRQLDKFSDLKNEIIKFADKGLSFWS